MMKFTIPNDKTTLTEAEVRAFVRTCLRAVTKDLFKAFEKGDLSHSTLTNDNVKVRTLREITNCARANSLKPQDTLFLHRLFRNFFDMLEIKKHKIVFYRDVRHATSAEHTWN